MYKASNLKQKFTLSMVNRVIQSDVARQ